MKKYLNLHRTILLILLIFLGRCTSGAMPKADPVIRKLPTPIPKDENTLILTYENWNGSLLPTYVLKIILEQELGYTVYVADEPTISAAFEAVAVGRSDIFSSAWFPNRDFSYDKYPNLVKLGVVYGGKAQDAYEGWMVSADFAQQYGLTHVADLHNQAVIKALDIDGDGLGNLIDCVDSWSCSKRHRLILADYGLTNLYEIEPQHSEEQMLATIQSRLEQGQPALFYMYQPVAFPGDTPITEQAVWLQGAEAYLRLAFNRTVVRGDLITHHPQVAQILSEYKIPGQDIAWATKQIAEQGTSPQVLTQLAQSWIDNHPAEVDLWLAGIESRRPKTKTYPLIMAYSPEKEDMFLKLVIAYNRSRPEDLPPIHPLKYDMVDMLDGAVEGKFGAMSPDSSIWLTQLDRLWHQKNPDASPLVGQHARYALSPIVIAMWESLAIEMGYPNQAVGWQDLMERASTDPDFQWSHHATSTASGLLATTAEFYAGANKSNNLTRQDIQAADTIAYVKAIESTVERYGGESEDRVVTQMLVQGGRPLDAFVAQEQAVIYFNLNTPRKEKLVAIYPQEGTFWMDHPLVLLDGPWVKEAQRRTFREFARFVLEPEQQQLVLQAGYRPGDVAISLAAAGSLIKPAYKVDPAQPKTLLNVPSAGVLENIRELWKLTKKPANIYLVVDVSGSMSGDKLNGVKGALFSFVNQIEGEHDRLGLITFSNHIQEVQTLKPLDSDHKTAFQNNIRKLSAGGGTQLYHATAYALQRLQQQGDADRINVIIAMTDGISEGTIEVVESQMGEVETPVLIFTLGYGADADLDVLQQLANLGDGQAFSSDPETIGELYKLLSAFF